jgi:methionyl aminopeptidase
VIAIRTERELDFLRKADRIVADVLATLSELVQPGITTNELDVQAEQMIRDTGATPAFLGYKGFPKSTCISVDSEIVHGIPGNRILEEGEIVSMDVGVNHKGYYGDAALTVACGTIDDERTRLMETTERALANAIDAARPDNHLSDISKAVEQTCEAEGFSIVRNFVGHGIGTQMHEEPQIPNFYTGERGPKLKAGMVLAIEPMVNIGTHEVNVLDDGWTAVTADGKPSAHFEHSIAIRDGEAEILSRSPKRTWATPDKVALPPHGVINES